jgi:thioredoxin reductase (NADPH)
MSDVIVIGSGAAGLSAALWCDELGFETLVLESEPEIGGQLLWVYNSIENHLGTIHADNGRELRDLFAKQIEAREFKLRIKANVESVDLARKTVFLANGEELQTKSLILATGIRRRKLNILGEDKFVGKGILRSGKLDQDWALGKNVAVIGGGDAAAENALILSEVAKKIYLIHRGKEFRARKEFLEKIRQNSRIEILLETETRKFLGQDRVEAIKLQKKDSAKAFQIDVEAILIRIGVEPNSEIARGQIELDSKGYIKIDNNCETSMENVFAVGDVANPLAPTVSSAVGMGATAANVLAAKFRS